jgi:hypothetical protein
VLASAVHSASIGVQLIERGLIVATYLHTELVLFGRGIRPFDSPAASRASGAHARQRPASGSASANAPAGPQVRRSTGGGKGSGSVTAHPMKRSDWT